VFVSYVAFSVGLRDVVQSCPAAARVIDTERRSSNPNCVTAEHNILNFGFFPLSFVLHEHQ
jgi:hypothetical protein